MRRRFPVVGAAGLLLALFGYLAGPGLGGTGDSFHYLATARNLRETGQLLDLDGVPYRFWGPLYPVLLAVFYSPEAAIFLHGAALLGSLLLWNALGEMLLPPRRARWLPWLLALSTAVLVPARFIWAETVFGLLAAGYFFSLLKWLRTGHGGWLAAASTVGFLLPLQRTSGFFLLAGVGVGLLATRAVRGRWLPLILHGVFCVAGGLAWSYYAEVQAGPPVYQALGGWAKLVSSAADYGFVLVRWFVPLASAWRAQWPLLWLAGLPMLLVLLWPRPEQPESRRPPSPTIPHSVAPALRLLWWAVLVDVLLHLLATNVARGAAGVHDAERYMAAVAGALILLALARWPAAAGGRRWRFIGPVFLGVWLSYSAIRTGHNAHALRQRPPVQWPKN